MSTRTRSAPHGSPAGYQEGCRATLECPNHGSAEVLTCVEAAIRRRGDWRLRQLPVEQQLPVSIERERPSQPDDHERGPVHGTQWGYRRGCRERRACPNWALGRVTCPDARRSYLEQYRRRRLDGIGAAIQHGTLAGYDAGCRDESSCPSALTGSSCAAARRSYKLARARAAGVRPVSSASDPEIAARVVRRWMAAGHSMRAIARAADVSRNTVVALASLDHGGSRRFSEQIVERILAATQEDR